MARVAAQLTNFTGGELSPRLDGRNDLTKYSSGCKTLENFIVYPHGAAARRSGTTFVAEVASSANKTRLIPFELSTTQTYMLEFSNLVQPEEYLVKSLRPSSRGESSPPVKLVSCTATRAIY